MVIALRARDRFIDVINENEEQLLTQRINYVRKQIKMLYQYVHKTCAVIEPCNSMLIWGTLQRCLICIESCVSLVSDGYVGSANALLRQIYEFLVWSKAGIDSDVTTLRILNAAFYTNSLAHRISATDILKAVKINIKSTQGSYTGSELKSSGKKMYHGYSLLTHASNISQQAPYKQKNFYSDLNACLNEICLLLDVFLIVFSQYLDVLYRPFLDEKNLSDEEQGYLLAAKVHAGEIKYRLPLYHKELCSRQNVHATFLQASFIEKWHMDKNKLS